MCYKNVTLSNIISQEYSGLIGHSFHPEYVWQQHGKWEIREPIYAESNAYPVVENKSWSSQIGQTNMYVYMIILVT